MSERLYGMGMVFQCVALITMSLTGSHSDLRHRVALGFSLLAIVCILVGGPWLWR